MISVHQFQRQRVIVHSESCVTATMESETSVTVMESETSVTVMENETSVTVMESETSVTAMESETNDSDGE